MKKYLFLLVIMFFCGVSAAQVQTDENGVQYFEMQDGDTTYVMKQYFMCFLKKGPSRDQAKEETAKIQEAHLAHLSKLAEEKKISIAGPFGSDGDISGIVIYNVGTIEEAKKLADEDPAVKAGRLVTELHPFWAAAGSTLR